MGNPAEIKIVYLKIFGKLFPINIETILYSWLIIIMLLILSMVLKKRLKIIPGKFQVLIEVIYKYFEEALVQTMGEKGKKFLPLILSIFLFVLFSNWISVIPGAIPPTKDLNTCLGLALLVLFIAHFSAIKEKGFRKYLKGYISPSWILLPSNIFAEFGKTLSHGFRLFGNIFAGGAMISILPVLLVKLFKWVGIPVGLLTMPVVDTFFGLFIGGIQAFVFTVLAMAYISILIE
jgi:F-type H+-transporting ATPase subunit a